MTIPDPMFSTEQTSPSKTINLLFDLSAGYYTNTISTDKPQDKIIV
jgi:hypothetical protein